MVAAQIRAHMGHSHSHGQGHGHGHAHDNAYLTSANRKDAGVRITRIGLFVNLGMAIGKGIGGYMFHSQALIADAFHALTDMVSDVLTLATISWSLKPATSRFPLGYGKVESLGALGVSGLLLFGGMGLGLTGLDALYAQLFVDAAAHSHEEHAHGLFSFIGHTHSHGGGIPNLNAAWLAAGSIFVKEWLYRATMKIAQERKSAVLASNAIHHRVDSLTSVVALLTIAGSHMFTDASWLDPVGGLIISAMVIKAGWNNTLSSLLELGDITVEDEIKTVVKRSATKALIGNPARGYTGVQGGDQVEIRDVQGTKSGQNYLMDLEMAVPRHFTIEDINPIEEAVRQRVGTKVRGVRRVRVKFVPQDNPQRDLSSDFIPANVSPQSSPEPSEDFHEHDHLHEHSQHDHVHQHDHAIAAHKNEEHEQKKNK